MPYHTLEPLRHIYLEDSYVLDIVESPDTIIIIIETVLTEAHPAYRLPSKDMQYCYRHAEMIFPVVTECIWLEKNTFPNMGPSQEMDFGNIDSFVMTGDTHELAGNWGHVKIKSSPLTFELLANPYVVDKPKFLRETSYGKPVS